MKKRWHGWIAKSGFAWILWALMLIKIEGRAASVLLPSSELSIAAAADLAPCMEKLNQAFQVDKNGEEPFEKDAAAGKIKVNIKVSIGASGSLFAQILQGAPFDVFLSANKEYPLKLAQAGWADASTAQVYAYGQLAMWRSDRVHAVAGKADFFCTASSDSPADCAGES